jgi:hypothetical protein
MTHTDEQIIRAARTRLAGELADLTPPAGLLAAVCRRHARRRRSLLQAAGAAAAAAAVVASAAIVTRAAGPGGRPAARLAAWTVITQPSGTVAVSIRDLRDPAGLQRALQAHGVPAIVRFHPSGSPMPGCVIPGGSPLASAYQRVFRQPPAAGRGGPLLRINPAAVPLGAEIGIDAAPGTGISIALLTKEGRCLPPSKATTVGLSHS